MPSEKFLNSSFLLVIYYEARSLFGCQTRVGVWHRHILLHWIMSFSQIIICVDVSVSVSCLMFISVSVLHRWYMLFGISQWLVLKHLW
jgi:hypothetical protein